MNWIQINRDLNSQTFLFLIELSLCLCAFQRITLYSHIFKWNVNIIFVLHCKYDLLIANIQSCCFCYTFHPWDFELDSENIRKLPWFLLNRTIYKLGIVCFVCVNRGELGSLDPWLHVLDQLWIFIKFLLNILLFLLCFFLFLFLLLFKFFFLFSYLLL